LFGDNGYLPFKSTTQNQNLSLQKDFYLLPTQAKKKAFITTGIHGNPAKRDLRKIMGKNKVSLFSKLILLENSVKNKKCSFFQLII
jgi:hypothetical protein